MSTVEHHTRLLDQLQNEVNRILENTGRLYATAGSNNKSLASAQADRLKQILPGSVNRFHEALDQLDDELQLAKAVMRRDLAVSREQSTGSVRTANKSAVAMQTAPAPPKAQAKNNTQRPIDEAALANGNKSGQAIPSTSPGDGDADMRDVLDLASQTTATSVDSAKVEDANTKGVAGSPGRQAGTDGAVIAEAEVFAEVLTSKSDSSNSALHVDTKSVPMAPLQTELSSDHPPDTAATYTTNADLESLFNDPTSADGVDVSAGDLPEASSTSQPASAVDFDFDAFSAELDGSMLVENDHDNISALLPGLQDYANTSQAADSDGSGRQAAFDALFASDDPTSMAGERPSGLQQRDSTFDELMSFADFNAENFGDVGNVGDAVEVSDFDIQSEM